VCQNRELKRVADSMSENQYAIEILGFGKRYDDHWAVHQLELRIPYGCFFGFVGPNGAGKSTTIKAMAGLIRPSRGSIRIEGFDISKAPLEVKARVGVMLEEPVLYERLTAREYLTFVGQMYGLEKEEITRQINLLLELMSLEGDKFMGAYSLGMKKKAALAAALIHKPKVIILDEPFSGIDATSASRIRKFLNQLVSLGHTVFFSSHVLETVEKISTSIGIIHQGKLLATGTLDEVREKAGCSDNASLEEVFLRLVGAGEVNSEGWFKPGS